MRNDDRFVPGRCLAPLLTCPFILIGALSLWYALIVHDLGVPCVANVSSRNTSLSFRITAPWGTQNGSRLPRCLIMAAFVATAMAKCWDRDKPLLPWVTVMMALVLAFFPFLVLVLGWGGYWGWDP
ncbi:MAG: hypothetical protein RMJ86_11030, partial [Anaerolineae bacterium]|nr:hypothetical protein [Anaerolineae bacterium]